MKKRIVNLLKISLVGCGLFLTLASCNNEKKIDDSEEPTIVEADAKDNNLNDMQIASIQVAAHQVVIDWAKLGIAKALDTDVKDYAKTMEKEHKNLVNQITNLAEQLKLTPEDNATSQSLASEGQTRLADLNEKTGIDFDKAYIDNEVAFDESIIKTVEETLIPGAENHELRAWLESVLPLLKTHLEDAKKIQEKLNK